MIMTETIDLLDNSFGKRPPLFKRDRNDVYKATLKLIDEYNFTDVIGYEIQEGNCDTDFDW